MAQRINRIDKMVGKWGTASISDVLLIEDKGQFAINYDAKVEDYVAKARESYQAAVWRSVQESIDVKQAQRSLTNADEVAKAAALGGPQNKAVLDAAVTAASKLSGMAAPQKGQGADTGEELGDEGQVEQTIPSFTSILPESNPAAAVLSSEKFTDPLAHADPPSGISERRAMLTGINDKVTENILKYLAHPTAVPDNKVIYFGIIEVSCNPGWGTREGYIAEVSVTPEYAKLKPATKQKEKDESRLDTQTKGSGTEVGLLQTKSVARKGSSDDEYMFSSDSYLRGGESALTYPSVLAAFPLQEAQTLDLRNSERYQNAMLSYMASLLVAQGSSQQAEELLSRVRRDEYDAASRTTIPVVSSYASGSTFGFQFIPEFQAIGDPANRNNGAANRLQPYSFPALIIVVCDKQDIAPEDEAWSHLVLTTTTRWVPVEKYGHMPPKQLGARDRIAIAAELDSMIAEVNALYESSALFYGQREIEAQIRSMEELAGSKSIISVLPEYKQTPKVDAPTISKALPEHGYYNANTVLTITGTGFAVGTQSIVKSVTVGGRLCDFQVAGPGVIIAVVPPWTEDPTNHKHEHDNTGEVVVATTKGASKFGTAITFDRHLAASPAPSSAEIALTRDAQGNITGIVVNETGTTKDKVLDLFGETLGGGEGQTLDLSDVDLSVTVK